MTSCVFPFFLVILLHLLTDWYTHARAARHVMIDKFDLHQDGKINEQEFIAIMMDES